MPFVLFYSVAETGFHKCQNQCGVSVNSSAVSSQKCWTFGHQLVFCELESLRDWLNSNTYMSIRFHVNILRIHAAGAEGSSVLVGT